APTADGGGRVSRNAPALGRPDLPGPCRAVRELPRSFHRARRLGASRGCRRAAFLFPLLDDAQYLQPGRSHHAGGPDREERNPHRGVRQSPPGDRQGQAGGGGRGGGHTVAADPDDDRGNRHGPLPARPRHRAWGRGTQQHRHHAGQRNDHRHDFHALCGAIHLHARCAQARAFRRGAGSQSSRARRSRVNARLLMNTRFIPGSIGAAVALGALLAASTSSAQVIAGSEQQKGTVQPRETLQLPLDDAVRRAVENNPELAIVKLGTEVEAARVGESRTAYTPMFSTVLGRSSSATPPSNFLLGDRGVDVDDLFSSTGVRQRLPIGSGTWSVSWESSPTGTNNPISSFDPSLQSGMLFAFSQPLLKDRSIDAARQQYIIAKRNLQSSDLHFREAAVQTVAPVKQAYWTLKASLANITVQQRSLELAQELARENRVKVDAGQIPRLDLVQAEAEVAQRRENLIRARTGAEDAEDALRRLIVDPADLSFWRLRIDPVEEPTRLGALPDIDAAVEKALNERYDLARADIELENAKSNVAFLPNQLSPDVRLETSYQANGL